MRYVAKHSILTLSIVFPWFFRSTVTEAAVSELDQGPRRRRNLWWDAAWVSESRLSLTFQEQGPKPSIIQHTSPHHSPQQDVMVVCGRVWRRKIKLLFVQNKWRQRAGDLQENGCIMQVLLCMWMDVHTLHAWGHSVLYVCYLAFPLTSQFTVLPLIWILPAAPAANQEQWARKDSVTAPWASVTRPCRQESAACGWVSWPSMLTSSVGVC